MQIGFISSDSKANGGGCVEPHLGRALPPQALGCFWWSRTCTTNVHPSPRLSELEGTSLSSWTLGVPNLPSQPLSSDLLRQRVKYTDQGALLRICRSHLGICLFKNLLRWFRWSARSVSQDSSPAVRSPRPHPRGTSSSLLAALCHEIRALMCQPQSSLPQLFSDTQYDLSYRKSKGKSPTKSRARWQDDSSYLQVSPMGVNVCTCWVRGGLINTCNFSLGILFACSFDMYIEGKCVLLLQMHNFCPGERFGKGPAPPHLLRQLPVFLFLWLATSKSPQACPALAPPFPNEDPQLCRTPLWRLTGPTWSVGAWRHVDVVWALYGVGLKRVCKTFCPELKKNT